MLDQDVVLLKIIILNLVIKDLQGTSVANLIPNRENNNNNNNNNKINTILEDGQQKVNIFTKVPNGSVWFLIHT